MNEKIKRMAEEVYKVGHRPGGCEDCPLNRNEMCDRVDCYKGTVEEIATEIEEEYTRYKNLVGTIENYKEPVLDDIEKEYLKNVLAPWLKRDDKIKVVKHKYEYTDIYWLAITIEDRKGRTDSITFPDFCSKKMYAGMENGKYYTVEELGFR